jgi:hypothetical protein
LPEDEERIEMSFSGGFTFPNFPAVVFSMFIFVLWFWMLISVSPICSGDRAFGVFVYLISQHRGMAERQ